jgi:hypothetical protein
VHLGADVDLAVGQTPVQTVNLKIDGEAVGGMLGYALVAGGDHYPDYLPDVVLAAPFAGGIGFVDTGRVYLFSGPDLVTLAQTESAVVAQEVANDGVAGPSGAQAGAMLSTISPIDSFDDSDELLLSQPGLGLGTIILGINGQLLPP